MNDDVAEAVDELSNVVVILLVLGCDVDVIVLIEFSKWSSLPTSSSFTWSLLDSTEEDDGSSGFSAVAGGAFGAGCDWTGIGGRLATTIWYWLMRAAEAFNIVWTFRKSLSRSSTCFLSFPSMALSSSTVSWSRFCGIGGGGIVYGAIKGIVGKKKGGGIVAACAGIFGAVPEAEACWFPNPVWLSKFMNGFCWMPGAGSLGLAFWFKLLLLLLIGCCCGWVAVIGVRKIFNRQVGQVCWRWNHDLKWYC